MLFFDIKIKARHRKGSNIKTFLLWLVLHFFTNRQTNEVNQQWCEYTYRQTDKSIYAFIHSSFIKHLTKLHTDRLAHRQTCLQENSSRNFVLLHHRKSCLDSVCAHKSWEEFFDKEWKNEDKWVIQGTFSKNNKL